jgi:NitT/TauT family transport system permease protein
LRAALRGADVIVFLGAAALLWLIVRLAHGVTVPWNGVTALSTVSTAPAELPYYAARSLLRMFAALALSIVFTVVYATAEARLRRAEKVLLPLLDILQSVPILGFLRRRPGSQAANWCGCSGCPLPDAKTILAYTTTDGNERPPGP